MCNDENRIQWSRFLSGDSKAYGWLYSRYIRSLYRYGLYFTSDGEAVKDCIQDVFTDLYRNRHKLAVPANVKVYLFASLKNSLLRYLADNYICGREKADDAPFLLEPAVEDEYIDHEQLVRREKMIEKMLSILSPRQKEIIYYRFMQELQWDETCRLMAMNYQSAQNLLQRALKKMRENFKGEDFDF
jgi:RNA polymerase sigma factor (sigma-70 family)